MLLGPSRDPAMTFAPGSSSYAAGKLHVTDELSRDHTYENDRYLAGARNTMLAQPLANAAGAHEHVRRAGM